MTLLSPEQRAALMKVYDAPTLASSECRLREALGLDGSASHDIAESMATWLLFADDRLRATLDIPLTVIEAVTDAADEYAEMVKNGVGGDVAKAWHESLSSWLLAAHNRLRGAV